MQKPVNPEHYLEQVVENNVQKTMPKGYAKQVERMRKVKEEKEKMREEEERKAKGDRYETMRLMKDKAPSFLKSSDGLNRSKNQLLLSI
jgi:hypothetical protein